MGSSDDPQAKKYIAESKCSVSMIICIILCFLCYCLGHTRCSVVINSHHMMSLCCYVECFWFYPVDNHGLGSASIILLVPTESYLSLGHSQKG